MEIISHVPGMLHNMTRSLLSAEGQSLSQAALGSPDELAESVEEVMDAAAASRAVLTQLVILGAALGLGQWLEKKKVSWLGDAGVALLLGVLVGILSRVFTFSKTYISWMGFQTEVFFIVCLPVIMYESGLSLQVKPFFRNIGAICTFAFYGTVVSTATVGLMMWGGGAMGFSYGLTLVEALVFGAIISTTDTVTIVAVLQKLGANEDLFALVFGESCLNDAVGIVLYRTLATFLHKRVTGGSVAYGFVSFIAIFLGSVLIGVGVAFLASLIFKTKFLRHHHTPLESCMVVLFALSSYMLADSFGLSGIVSILFCGLVSAHYVRPNISRNARDRTAAFFKVLSVLAEIFVFSYIGTSITINVTAWKYGLTWTTLVVAVAALAVARAVAIWPAAVVINALRPPDLRIPQSQQFMIWFSGMRGAMAFAMVLRSLEDLPEEVAHVLLVVTFFLILITVLVNGGAAASVMKRLKLRAEDDAGAAEAALAALGPPRDGRHVHISLGDAGAGGLAALNSQTAGGVERSQASASSMAGSEASSWAGSVASGYSTDGTAPGRPRSFSMQSMRPGRVLARVRESNREGMLAKLEHLDDRYLSKIFLNGKTAREVEMSEMSSQGDDDDTPRSQQQHHHVSFAIAAGGGDTGGMGHGSSPPSLERAHGGSGTAQPLSAVDAGDQAQQQASPHRGAHQPSGSHRGTLPLHSAMRHPGSRAPPSPLKEVHRLADFNRSGIDQVDVGDELLQLDQQDAHNDEGSPMIPHHHQPSERFQKRDVYGKPQLLDLRHLITRNAFALAVVQAFEDKSEKIP